MKAVSMIDLRCLIVVSAVLIAPWNALASPELARSKNCVACHSVERRMIGPPFKDIAEWLDHYRQFWDQSFDRLDAYLRMLQSKGGGDGPQS